MSKKVQDWNIAVVGAGTMGLSIAQLFATHGHEVNLYNRTPANLEKAMVQLGSNLQTMVDLGELEAAQVPEIIARIHGTSDLKEAVADADFIIENVAEVQEIKEKIFAQIDEYCKEDAVISSDTSTMDIYKFVKIRRMDKLIITHFFLPAYVIPLVEVVRGPETSDETVAQAKELLESMGKMTAVLNKVIPGFIVNRITMAIFREVNYLVEQGLASPQDIDKAVVGVYGPRYAFEGPFGLCDFASNEFYIGFSNLLMPELSNATACPKHFYDMVEEGKLGVKSGKGFYDYDLDPATAASRRSARITKMIQAIRAVNAEFDAK